MVIEKELVSVLIELERGEDLIPVKAEAYVHYLDDYHYGADADGNRGSYRCIVEDVTDVVFYNELGEEIKIVNEGDINQAVDQIIEKFLNN